MKKIIIILVLISIFLSCKNEQVKEFTVANQKKEITVILNNWHKAAADANYENYFNTMDSVAVFIGTDASENWTKEKFANFSKPYFDKGKAWDFKPLERTIYISNSKDVVWFDELLTTWMGTCRGSGVLEKTNNSWKIKQYVLSVAVPNEDVQKVILAKQKNDSIFLKKFKK